MGGRQSQVWEGAFEALSGDWTGDKRAGIDEVIKTDTDFALVTYRTQLLGSVTMYKLPQSLLVDNPINRYLINSAMLPDLVKDPDGGLTLYIRNTSPGADKEANWLPAPTGPFAIFMRLYWPKPEALDGSWQAPLPVKN